jgi:hypothetical protein
MPFLIAKELYLLVLEEDAVSFLRCLQLSPQGVNLFLQKRSRATQRIREGMCFIHTYTNIISLEPHNPILTQ